MASAQQSTQVITAWVKDPNLLSPLLALYPIRKAIFKAAMTFDGKNPELLKALRPIPELYQQALQIFNKQNTFKLTSEHDFGFRGMSDNAISKIRRLEIVLSEGIVGSMKVIVAIPAGVIVPAWAVPIGANPAGGLPGAIHVGVGVAVPLAALPGGAVPPGAVPPGAIPPGAIPPVALPPGALPPVALPPVALPPGALPLGALPPGVLPLGAFPPGALPLMIAIPIGAIPAGPIPVNAIVGTLNSSVQKLLRKIMDPQGLRHLTKIANLQHLSFDHGRNEYSWPPPTARMFRAIEVSTIDLLPRHLLLRLQRYNFTVPVVSTLPYAPLDIQRRMLRMWRRIFGSETLLETDPISGRAVWVWRAPRGQTLRITGNWILPGP